MLRPTRIAALAAAALSGAALTVALAAPAQALAVPATPRGLPAAIESLGGYTAQVACDPHIRPGTRKLARLLAATYPAATGWASTYACGTDGSRSEHYDGRAIDWMVDVHNPRQLAAAQATISWLLATDRAGNRNAMARRLGIMYIIFDNRMWGGWSGRWEDYNGCSKLRSRANDNACHRTHMHLSLTWNGAMGTTTFWQKRLSPTNYGPCRARDLNWAGRYARPNLVGCRSYPAVKPAKGSSATKKALVTYSGAAVRSGWRGPAVTAVQQALHVRADGSFGSATRVAVQRFQQRHHLARTGVMGAMTWRALLRAVR